MKNSDDKALDLYPITNEIAESANTAEHYSSGESPSSEGCSAQIMEEPESEQVELVVIKKRRPRIHETQQHLPLSVVGSNMIIEQTFSNNRGDDISQSKEDVLMTGLESQDNSKLVIEHITTSQTGYQKQVGFIKQVLAEYFRRGFRLNSPIELKRFRTYYKALHGKTIHFADDKLEDYIQRMGFEYDGKIYLVEKVISSQFAEEIGEYIRSVFLNERDYIFYKALYAHFEESFLDSQIADSSMLKCWLEAAFAKNFIFTKNYIASASCVTVSVRKEVETFIRDSHSVVTLDQLKFALDYLPMDKVQHEWNFMDELITNGRNEKFHIATFVMSSNDRETISKLITSYLQDNPFITGDALINELRMNIPGLFNNNPELSSLGIRKAISYHFKDHFSFRNNIISDKNAELDGVKAMVEFCRKREYFTIEEAESMAEIIGTSLNVYLEHISKVAIRVNSTDFIPIREISFDTENIDKALDKYIHGDFTPFVSIEHFEAFPSCGEYPWNLRLLESYLLSANSRYSYYHSTFLAKDSIAGAIVKKESLLKSYEEVLIQALGESDIDLNEASANDYLYEKGLIARRQKNGPVKGLLLKAKECRNRIKRKKI